MDPKILIIGASGFVGSYLLNFFEKQNISVRCLARTPQKVFSEKDTTQIFKGDLEDPQSIKKALEGIEVIYYLSHSMGYAKEGFKSVEIKHAQNLADLTTPEQRIIYLGGIQEDEKESEHLESRKEVGAALASGSASVIEFRASIIIGKGSTSYEMIRAYVQRIPFIITTDWTKARCQPLAISDVIQYLAKARDLILSEKHLIVNIGGPEVVQYQDLLVRFAEVENLRRPKLDIPLLPKKVAKEIMRAFLPEYYEVGEKLLDSIEISTIVTDHKAKELFDIQPISLNEAMEKAKSAPFEEVKLLDFLEKLKSIKDVPTYFKGQKFLYEIPIKTSDQWENFLKKINDYLPALANKMTFDKNELNVKLPFIGQLELYYKPDYQHLLIAFSPKYFFQHYGQLAFNKLLEQIEKYSLS